MKECLLIFLKAFDFHIYYENGEFHINAKIKGLKLVDGSDDRKQTRQKREKRKCVRKKLLHNTDG